MPELAQLQHLEAPVSGTLRTRIDLAQRRAQGSRLDLAFGKGQLHSDWLPTGSVAIDKGELHAVYAPEDSEVRLDRLALDLGGGTELVLDGTLAGVTPELIAAPADARPPGHSRRQFAGDADDMCRWPARRTVARGAQPRRPALGARQHP